MILWDDGTDDRKGTNTQWENEARVRCCNCDHVGIVFDFTCSDEEKRHLFSLLLEKRKADQARLDNWVCVAKESRTRGDLLEVGDAFMQLADTNGEIEVFNAFK